MFDTTVVAALIGLLGAALVALLAYNQWKSEQKRKQREQFITAHNEAYMEFWKLLEHTHVMMRIGYWAEDEFDNVVAKVNGFLLKNDLYIREQDGSLGRGYVEALYRLARLLRQSENSSLKRDWLITTPALSGPQKEEQTDPAIIEAWNEMDDLRENLKIRIRSQIGGD